LSALSPINRSAKGAASLSVIPSPTITTVLYPCLSFSSLITAAFPWLREVNWVSLKPAYSPKIVHFIFKIN
jgi:hypothetical protein